LSTANEISPFRIVTLHCAMQGGCTTVCIHTHMHTNMCAHYFQVQTSDVMIKKRWTQNVIDLILTKFTLELNEIAWCTLQ